MISHEYGHDLGLPDLYDSIGPTETDVGWWDLMSTGSHSGPLFQTIPTHMGAWSKYVLGWIDPEVLPYGAAEADVLLGQASRPPAGTDGAVKVELPDKRRRSASRTAARTPGGRARTRRRRRPADPVGRRAARAATSGSGRGTPTRSRSSGTTGSSRCPPTAATTWTELEVFDEAGNVVSTDEDPNGNLRAYFGGLENGLTGDSGGYRHDYVDLTPYAGQRRSSCGCA